MGDVMERPRTSAPRTDGVSANDLARGMILLRASNMNVMRLQLAVERHDRKSAMAAMDDLVGIDRELDRFIGSMPGAAADYAAVSDELDRHKQSVVSERVVMARGKVGPAVAPVPDVVPLDLETADIVDEEGWHAEPDTPSIWPKVAIGLVVATVFAFILFVALGGLSS